MAADLGVGEAEPRAEPERIGEEQQQQHRGRQKEQQAERVAVVLDAREECGQVPPSLVTS